MGATGRMSYITFEFKCDNAYPYTVEFYMKLRNLYETTILNKDGNGTSRQGNSIVVHSPTVIGTGGSVLQGIASFEIDELNTNDYYHFVLGLEQERIVMYINGKLVGDKAVRNNLLSYPYYKVCDHGWGKMFRVYRKVLNQQEVLENYKDTLRRFSV